MIILKYKKKLIVNFLFFILTFQLLSSCTNKSGARMGLFSATSPVTATIKDDIFVGWAKGDISGRGKIDVRSSINKNITCVGEFRYISTFLLTGTGTLSCNDGAQANFNFKGLTNLKGHGYGNSSRGPVTFTYGMTAEEAAKYLQKPVFEVEESFKARSEP